MVQMTIPFDCITVFFPINSTPHSKKYKIVYPIKRSNFLFVYKLL